jgi:tetratricopeptide (TPR) repeat protein
MRILTPSKYGEPRQWQGSNPSLDSSATRSSAESWLQNLRVVSAAVLLTISSVFAAGLQDAKALYARGEFQKASDVALVVGGSDAMAFAAKANSLFATTQPLAEQEALYDKSERYALEAIKLNAKNDAGYLELARVTGRLAQFRGILVALSQGVPTRMKDNLEKAIQLNSKNATALVALALWHAQIASSGAGFVFGADTGKVVPLLEKAIALEPDQIIHRVEYAHALIVLDANKNKTKAIELLEKAVSMKANDVAEGFDLERAKKDLAALK